MSRLIIVLTYLPLILWAQYWGERVTEESFEQSELYFNSYYLNTFGLNRFREVSVGLVDDPFLELYLNPANLPDLNGNNLVYLDFRGDRTEPAIVENYRIYPIYELSYRAPIYIDPRWYENTRREPEPIFSAGLLLYPIKLRGKNLFLGGTYQLIHKQEKFYTVPSWIYANRYGYDVFGAKAEGDYNIPIEDRYAGEDEMLNSGQLFSGFLGYPLTDKLNLGLSIDGVFHSRDGSYMNLNNDEYGNTDNYDWSSLTERSRDQKYHHLDLAGGIRYRLKNDFFAGMKLGFLTGKAEQEYGAIDSSRYNYTSQSQPEDWSRSFTRNTTQQNWDHDGKNWYGSLNITKTLQEKRILKFYYRYTHKKIDLTNNSSINDTSYYASHWSWDTTTYDYLGESRLSDRRNGSGKRKADRHEGMLSMHWQLTDKNGLSTGIYLSRETSQINSLEPVVVDRRSHYQSTGYYPYSDDRELFEDKSLNWKYKTSYSTVQIPIFVHFKFNSIWAMMIGVNRILYTWEIKDQTLAIFKIRRRVENGEVHSETNFGERYREPNQHISEDFTEVLTKFEASISPQFKIHLLLNPEFKDNFRIAQWWLGFVANL